MRLLSARSQTQKATYSVIPLVRHSGKGNLEGKETPVVVRGWGAREALTAKWQIREFGGDGATLSQVWR